MTFFLSGKDGPLETGIGKREILRKERPIDRFLSHGDIGIGKAEIVADAEVVSGLCGVSKLLMEEIEEIVGSLVSFLEGEGNLSFRLLFVDPEKGTVVFQKEVGKEKVVESIEGIGLKKDRLDIVILFRGTERILKLVDEVFKKLFPSQSFFHDSSLSRGLFSGQDTFGHVETYKEHSLPKNASQAFRLS